jgi:hypothetical protein
MNKKSVCAVLLAFAGSASIAWATPKAYLQVYDGVSWTNSVNVAAGSTVQVRYMVDWTGTTAYGFFGVLTKLQFDGVDDQDLLPGRDTPGPIRTAPFTFGSEGTLIAEGSGSSIRVGLRGSNDAVGFFSPFQTPPNLATNFSTAPVVQLASWSVKLSESRALGSTLSLSALVSQTQSTGTGNPTNAFAFVSSATSTSTSFRESGTVEGALITVSQIPAPGTLAIPAIAFGAGVFRRRRNS